MKNHRLPFTCLLSALLAVGGVSCNDDDTDRKETPKITVSATGIDLPGEGGTFEIGYRTTDGRTVTAGSEATWLRSFDCSEQGLVRFFAEANPGETRSAQIVLSAPGAESVPVTVTQGGGEPAAFSFEATEITSSGATVKVSPLDAGAYYTWDVMPSEEFDRLYDSDEALIEEHLGYLDRQLEEYRATVDAGATLAALLVRGDDSQRIQTLDPETEYTVFAFGVDETGEATTAPATCSFSTPAFRITDDATFAVEFSRVEQLQFAFSVTPSSDAVRYYIGLCEAALLTESSPEEVASDFLRRAEIAEVEWTNPDALYSGPRTLHTYEDLEIADLEPATEYSVVLFGVSPLGERTTAVSHAEIRTLDVPRSDMTFGIEVLETSLEGAVLKITPSIPDETYMAGCIRKEEYEKFGSDTEFMEYAVSVGNIVLLEGEQILDRTGALLTDTEYICFAFGYIGGITTDLTRIEFTTRKPETAGKAEVSVEIVAREHASYDVAIYAYLTPNEWTEHWYAGAFNSIDGVAAVPFTGEKLSDAEVINQLTTDPNSYYWDSEYAAAGAFFGREYTFYVIARDAEGNLGPLVKKTVVADPGMLAQ